MRLWSKLSEARTNGKGAARSSTKPGEEVAAISCRPEDRKRFDELHALYQSGVHTLDPGLLEETAEALDVNSGSYTVWMLRRRVLTQFPSLLNFDELEFVRDWTRASLKNYQAWFHRRWVVERLLECMRGNKTCGGKSETTDPEAEALRSEEALCEDELKDVTAILQKDAKNMSAWSHRVWIRSVYAQPLDVEFSWNMQWLRADPFNNSAWMFRQFLANEKAEGKSERGKTRCAGRRLREVAASAPATADGKQSEDAYKQDEEEQDIDRRPETQKTEKTGERPSEEGKRRDLRRKANVWMEEVRFALVSWNAHPSNEAACRYLLHAAKQALGALRQIDRDETGDSSEATVETKHTVSDWSAAVDDAAQKDANDANDPEIDSPRLLQLLRRSAERVCEEVATCCMQRPSSSSSPSSSCSDSSASFSNQANDEGAKKQTAAFPDSREDERPSCPRGEQKGALRFALEMLLFCAIEQGRLCDACTTCMHLAEVDPIRRAYWTWRSEAFVSQ
uniref:Protein farnesyltransferase/geranylgeranyltransferase type-1 subunit alpha n=1 Tax=Toxoplasma gondii (strain ATCC 50861 / VEG) TaxID=432359 RepID=A0A0F7USN5_TOXGV|nr:TPA: Protein farnesyltransferase/geranylgeranyltransferase type-1 subunit alpha, related [Toxoplasma gondii VEG]